MNDCKCKQEQRFMPPKLPKRAGDEECSCRPTQITLRTVTLPASVGTDEEGQTYEPKVGLFFNSIVSYVANGAVYIYDSNGIWTKLVGDASKGCDCDSLNNQIKLLTEQNAELATRVEELTAENQAKDTELNNILARLEVI